MHNFLSYPANKQTNRKIKTEPPPKWQRLKKKNTTNTPNWPIFQNDLRFGSELSGRWFHCNMIFITVVNLCHQKED